MSTVNLMRKIGKHSRPIFWALSLSTCVWAISKFFHKLFLGQLVIKWISRDGFLLTLSLLMILVVFLISLYRVTNPYISKEGYDPIDEAWGVGIFIAVILILIHLLGYFFHFNLLGHIFNANYENINI